MKTRKKIFVTVMNKFKVTLIILITGHLSTMAQVGVNEPAPNPDAILDIEADQGGVLKGLLIPRVADHQLVAVGNSPTGLLVYDLVQKKFYYWDVTWHELAPWDYSNSASESDLISQIGTNVGINTTAPGSQLSVVGNLAVGSTTYTNETVTDPDNGAIIEGDVGIGTTDPQEKLEVIGTVKATRFDGFGTVPIGGIIMWSGNPSTLPSSGWQLCDGGTFTHPITATIVNIPDLRGRFIVGYNPGDADYNYSGVPANTAVLNSSGTGRSIGGAKQITLTEAQMPAHNHAIGLASDTHGHSMNKNTVVRSTTGLSHGILLTEDGDNENLVTTGSSDQSGTGQFNIRANNDSHTHSVSQTTKGSSQAHENRPLYYTLAFIIRTQ